MTRRPDFRPIMRQFMAGESVKQIRFFLPAVMGSVFHRVRLPPLPEDVVEDAIRRAMDASEKQRKKRRRR